MENKKERSEVPALEASIRIIEYLSRYNHRTSSLADICKGLNINKSIAIGSLRFLKAIIMFFTMKIKNNTALALTLLCWVQGLPNLLTILKFVNIT